MWKFVNSKYNTQQCDELMDNVMYDYLIEVDKIISVLFYIKTNRFTVTQLNELTSHLYLIKTRFNNTTSNNQYILEKIMFDFTKGKPVNNKGKVIDCYTTSYINNEINMKLTNILFDKRNTTNTTNTTNTKPEISKVLPSNIMSNTKSQPTTLKNKETDNYKEPTPSINLLELNENKDILETNIKALEKELEEKTMLCSDKLYEINVKKQEERRKKEKEEERHRVFNSDINTYKLIKADIESGKLAGVPDIFVNKYKVLEVMEDEGVLNNSDNYDIFVDLYDNIDEIILDEPVISEDLKKIFD